MIQRPRISVTALLLFWWWHIRNKNWHNPGPEFRFTNFCSLKVVTWKRFTSSCSGWLPTLSLPGRKARSSSSVNPNSSERHSWETASKRKRHYMGRHAGVHQAIPFSTWDSITLCLAKVEGTPFCLPRPESTGAKFISISLIPVFYTST